MKTVLLIFTYTVLSACSNDSGFSGSGKKKQKDEPKVRINDVAKDEQTNSTSGEGGQIVQEKRSVEGLSPTSNVARQGTFTVWADPAQPVARQPYYIYIHTSQEMNRECEVRCIVGSIRGSDDYFDIFGDINAPADLVGSHSMGGTVVRVFVPGAHAKVRDLISVKVIDTLGGAAIDGPESLSLYFAQ